MCCLSCPNITSGICLYYVRAVVRQQFYSPLFMLNHIICPCPICLCSIFIYHLVLINAKDNWRISYFQINQCLYIQKKIEYSSIRAQVMELWSRGEKVSCGAMTEETRVTFRTSTAMAYMFIQMSAEMWDFDTCGEFIVVLIRLMYIIIYLPIRPE